MQAPWSLLQPEPAVVRPGEARALNASDRPGMKARAKLEFGAPHAPRYSKRPSLAGRMARQTLTPCQQSLTPSGLIQGRSGGNMRQRPSDPTVERMRKGVVPIEWLGADPDEISRIGRKRREEFLASAERFGQLQAGCRDRNECERLALRVARDQSLSNGDWLRGGTGLGAEAFFYLVSRLEDAIGGSQEAPLFRRGAGEDGASGRGNRRILPVEHMLCMVLQKVWAGHPQAALAGAFGVDQATASRSIRMISGMLASTGMLPTAETIRREIAGAPKERALEAVGGALSIGWVHVEIEGPCDKASNGEARSHKAGSTACKFLAWRTKSGLLVMAGPAIGVRGDEIEYLRRHLPNLGHATASLTSPDTPKGERITVRLNGGPQGADKVLAGANVKMTHKKPPGGGPKEKQGGHNSRLAGRRAMAGSGFAGIKAHRILGNVFRGSADDLEEALALVTGLVNFKRIMRGARGRGPGTRRGGAAARPDGKEARAASRATRSG